MSIQADDDMSAGAAAARHKLANALSQVGIQVRASRYGYPPTDEDFLDAVENYLRVVPPTPGERAYLAHFRFGELAYDVPIHRDIVKHLPRVPGSQFVMFHIGLGDIMGTLALAADRRGQVTGVLKGPNGTAPLEDFTLELQS